MDSSMKEVNLYPKVCNLCGGKVECISNSVIYGREYGSGYCYRCQSCGAYVGTHKPWPKRAMGILANAEMREWKRKCHEVFDSFRKNEGGKKRRMMYKRLAEKMNIQVSMCHFGYFDTDQLKQAYQIMKNWKV